MNNPERLRRELAALGWTQTKLAEELGVTLRAVRFWVAGDRPIPLYVWRYLEQAAAMRALARSIAPAAQSG
jgi:transcriptional regulator with XRE-family HTH domain